MPARCPSTHPVVRYVPDFSMKSPQYRQITVRMLLNHSAGVPGTEYADAWSDKPIPSYVDRALAGLANSSLKTTPGAINVYCNDCFTLAGLVVERVSGMPYHDYVTANILKPLGMKHSRYQTTVSAPGTVAPIIYGGKAQPIEITNLFASGGLMSTADDMARLALVFTNGGTVGGTRILSRSAIQQMAADETATALRVGPPSFLRYGLGWDCVQDPALKSAISSRSTTWGRPAARTRSSGTAPGRTPRWPSRRQPPWGIPPRSSHRNWASRPDPSPQA